MRDFEKLQNQIGIKFKDPDLLRQAVVHRSYLNENSNFSLDHNERLEFLGDAVLELVVTEHLYNNYPNPEGELTNWRSSLVNSNMLSEKSSQLGLNDYLYLSRGESKDIGKAREIILANAFEALIGAIYLDQGYTIAQQFIMKHIVVELPRILENNLYIDPKSKLQEMIQEKLAVTPSYKVLEEWGPDHDRQFKVGVFLDGKQVGEGLGSSKQQAQEVAAGQALESGVWEK
ncbi:ribonuclease III [Patescibacteria group bacterium]|nr:ribonuclease III [Patescibacteria group bacterium]